jgi:signal transduction histidine kinase/CheY-like chemotaxis protein
MMLMTTDHATDATPSLDDVSLGLWLEDHAAGDIVFTPDGWLLEANRPAELMLRLPAGQEARGLNFRRFCRHPERLTEAIQAIQVTGRLENWDGQFLAFDGSPLQTVLNLVGQFDSRRALASIHAYLFNITEWRRDQERNLLGQRIEAIGRLAGGIAHDFNNLLTVISGHTECLAQGLAPDDPLYKSVSAIQLSATRAASMTQKLLAFGRRQVLQPKIVDLGDLVGNVEADLRRTFGRRIAVSAEIERPVWAARVDSAQIESALTTIAAHAIDAMENEGAIRFRVSNLVMGLDGAHTRPFVQKGRYVSIELACSGLPTDADSHIRVFEPFLSERFRLRDGMGLAAVYGLIKQSGGYIWLDNDAPLVATFTLLLPAEAAVEIARPRPEAARKNAVILVVDADQAVRGLVVKLLAHQGYDVLAADTADEGLCIAEDRRPDLIISDVKPASGPGGQFEAEVLARLPGTRLVCMARRNDARRAAVLDPSRTVYLEKPLSSPRLAAVVEAMLES